MKISEEALKELAEIWHQENPDKEMDWTELIEMGQRILNTAEIIFQAEPTNKMEEPSFREKTL